MAGNGRGGGAGGAASISAAAAAVGSAEARFPPPERQQSRWGGCFGGFSCLGSQKGGTRIVPATRIPDGNGASRGNAPQSAGPSNQSTNLNLSLLAPPSSPASFTNSALPSTVQSPSCFLSLSANSPGGPSSTMFATGPYAHETHLVSPPVFSTYTTEPSTAPLTPPPELASSIYAPIFSYDQLYEATNGFDASNELGDGGFGTVYKGKLQDGRVVAVKRLYENNYRRVEQFMNEVKILSLLQPPLAAPPASSSGHPRRSPASSSSHRSENEFQVGI